jgi:two-component system LytT family response regulator
MIRTLLIEDDRLARSIHRRMLALHPEVRVVGEATSMRAARILLVRDNYDLVFLDIQLVGGNGFDLMADVRRDARVIFLTAHNQHALRAFEVNALDYLIKPVRAARLAASLLRLPRRAAEVQPPAHLHTEDTVLLKSTKHRRLVPIPTIVVIESQGNYSLVQLADGSRELVRRSLKDWAALLPAETFLRVYRTALVNLSHVTGFHRAGPKVFSLRLAGQRRLVPVSRDHWREVKQRLPKLAGSAF